MSIAILFVPMFFAPVAALVWRIVVTKTRSQWLRVGAAASAMLTLMGAFMIATDLSSLSLGDWRTIVALLAASSGSVYLLAWSQRKHGNRRHRTLSIIAAILGLVPIIASLFATVFFNENLW